MTVINSPIGSVYCLNNGNFSVSRSMINDGLALPLQSETFLRVFGRPPVSAFSLRADAFFRLCRLAGLVIHFDAKEKPPRPVFEGSYKPSVPMVKATVPNQDEHFPSLGLFLNDEGNFNILPSNNKVEFGWTLPVDICDFESMFGSSPRDYFANDVVRVTTLAGLKISIKYLP